jgi:hypothetical protein
MKRVLAFLLCLFLAGFAEAETMAKAVPAVYANSSSDGLVIANGKNWYLEELDSLGRPVSGTLWQNGEIAVRTSWLYSGEGQIPAKKIVTGKDGSTETDYDDSGNKILVVRSDDKGQKTSTLANTWNNKNFLVESVLTAGKTTTKTVIEYTGTDRKQEKRVYLDGKLAVRDAYTAEDSWTETLYNEGTPVLVVTYVDGARVKVSDEKKQ